MAAALPQQLGRFPLWRGNRELLPALQNIYRAASHRAAGMAMDSALSPDNLVVHQFWIDGYKDFNFMRASAVVKRQSTFMAS